MERQKSILEHIQEARQINEESAITVKKLINELQKMPKDAVIA
jgi:uncharacterized protein YaaN involved in tellurite resistance